MKVCIIIGSGNLLVFLSQILQGPVCFSGRMVAIMVAALSCKHLFPFVVGKELKYEFTSTRKLSMSRVVLKKKPTEDHAP